MRSAKSIPVPSSESQSDDRRLHRRTALVVGAVEPEQKLSVEDALAAYTLGGAFASFEQDQKEQIKAGKLADLTLIDQDLRSLPSARIRTGSVTRTIIGGKTVHRR